MYWQAPMVDRLISDERLQATFADVFTIDSARVFLTDDTSTLLGRHPHAPYILLERVERDGPFPLQLNVFLAGDVLERPVADLAGTLDYARALAQRLGAAMLFGTGPIGYEEQLRVMPDGTVDVVQLDGDELDEDRFVIVGARPFTEQPAEASAARIG